MTRFTSLRARLVGTVFVAIVPAWILMYYTDLLPWTGFLVGLMALGAAWFGGERFIMRQVRVLSKSAQLIGAGDLSSRTGLSKETGELGDLARTFDAMAQSLQQRVEERERAEKTLLNRSLQQTVVSALGQFAMVSNDVPALLHQTVMLVSQTLEVEFCGVLELQPGGKFLRLRAGVGWKDGCVEKATLPVAPKTECGFALIAGEPLVVDDFQTEPRFQASSLVRDHGVVSGVTVAVAGHGQAFGTLGAYTARRREFNEDEVHFLFAIATVLAMAVERINAQSELQKLAAFVQLNPNPAMELAADGNITYFNHAALALVLSAGKNDPCEILPANIRDIVKSCLAGQGLVRLETHLDGRSLAWSFHPVPPSKTVHCYVEDISNRLSLEAQLRQAQKMESVGQLAAGVAHDFNNMLTIIQGHAGMLTAKPSVPPDILDSTQAIYFAAERAAALTRQLLMFSRRNVIQLQPLDLRDVVSHMSKMLRRLLGETITLEFHPPPEMPLVQADGGMVEQVIMNLAVNARDAMPKGGTLVINTSPVTLDDAYCSTHLQARPGSFVCLRVTDTGSGMDATTLNRIFEPFFTTKEVGKGTGLGLATVYGIVKQHQGWIEVASELGKGSTFEVFVPASAELAEPKKTAEPAQPAEVPGGQETILVVEDEKVLREMAHTILENCGYHVLEASSGVEAIHLWDRHSPSIDLVLTDVVMPEGLSGMELAQKLRAAKPDLKIIFASGYSMDDMDASFIRDSNAAFLPKPYTHITLASAVRDCLDK